MQNVSRSHASALLGTATARLRALLAVIVLVLGALVAAGLADFGADPADLGRYVATASHETRGQPADGRTVNVERDAAGHHLHVLFLQAGRRAVVASVGAGAAGVDARLVLFVSHLKLLVRTKETADECSVRAGSDRPQKSGLKGASRSRLVLRRRAYVRGRKSAGSGFEFGDRSNARLLNCVGTSRR